MKIGVMGDKGSFSDEAALLYVRRKKIKKYSIKYLINADNVLKSLNKKKIDLGILPITNSTAGMVKETVKALKKYPFQLFNSFKMPIRHSLLIQKNNTKENVSKIISHIQALKQCQKYVKKNFPKAKKIEYEDTAIAAKDLASGKLSKTVAVIASKNCAEIYGLKILAKNIQDNKKNNTTFLVIRK